VVDSEQVHTTAGVVGGRWANAGAVFLGIPYATGDPGWAPYDPLTRSTRVYDAEPSTQPYPEERSRRIWHTHRFGTLDLND